MSAYSNGAWAQKQARADVAAQADAAGNEEVKRLRQRVEQLEEQLVDLQVTTGTLESLIRRGDGSTAVNRGGRQSSTAPGRFGNSSNDDGRLQTMEMQISALAQQVEQLTLQLNPDSAGDTGGQGGVNANSGLRPENARPEIGQREQGFGNLTVMPGNSVQPQPLDRIQPRNGAGASAPRQANYDGRPPRAIYDEAYKYLLVQNYGAAELAFGKFLNQYPNDQLSGNAQYWLGESYYVRGQYKNAAGAFLKGYKVYSKSQKAPDSLLKLAMSLKRLGQKGAACETFSELGTRFPRAPSHIIQRAQSERRRSGC